MSASNLNPAVTSELPPTSPDTQDELQSMARCFNTALISTRAESQGKLPDEFQAVFQTPAFRQILEAARRLAAEQGLSPTAAAEALIHAFRKVDQIWFDYVYQEGVQHLKGPGSGL